MFRSLFTNYRFGGVGRGTTGRLFSLTAGREFEFRTSGRFTLLRGVVLTLPAAAFALGRLTFAALFVLPLAFALAFSLVFFGRGFFGLFSLLLDVEFVLRFSAGSSGVTLSGVSPSLVARLMSIATVWPALTTSFARGN